VRSGLIDRFAAPLVVFATGLVARGVTAAGITFPIPEGSAYYLNAAQNLASGRGLVVDVVWSYATTPLEVPRAAFDLWQPLAAVLAAPVMVVLGRSLAAAQSTSVVLGALTAGIAWAVARDAARAGGLTPARAAGVALAAGLTVAVTPLLILQGAEPDSTAPFTLLALATCWLAPRALAERDPGVRWRLLLGAILGVAYLARTEAISLVIGYLTLAWLSAREPGLRRALPVIPPAVLIAGAWLLRQAMTWQSPPLGQLIENAWSVRASDIFAWADRPTLASHLAIGLPALLGLRLEAIMGNAALVLLTAFPAAILGIATVLVWPRVAALQALGLLGVSAVLSVTVDSLVFPVASRAGLYAHGAGPTICLL
jgi:hypothetical protein